MKKKEQPAKPATPVRTVHHVPAPNSPEAMAIAREVCRRLGNDRSVFHMNQRFNKSLRAKIEVEP